MSFIPHVEFFCCFFFPIHACRHRLEGRDGRVGGRQRVPEDVPAAVAAGGPVSRGCSVCAAVNLQPLPAEAQTQPGVWASVLSSYLRIPDTQIFAEFGRMLGAISRGHTGERSRGRFSDTAVHIFWTHAYQVHIFLEEIFVSLSQIFYGSLIFLIRGHQHSSRLSRSISILVNAAPGHGVLR